MAQIFLNNARGVLAAPIDAVTNTIALSSVVGLPASLAEDDWFLLTVYKDSTQYGEDIEVVKVTEVTDNGDGSWTLMVERGHEMSAVPHVVGERVEARLTAGSLEKMSPEGHLHEMTDVNGLSNALAEKRDTTNTSFLNYDLAVNDTYSANDTTAVDLDLSTGPQVAIVGNASLRTVNLNNPPTDRSILVIVYATGSAGLSFAQLPSAGYWDGGEVPESGEYWTQYLLWYTGSYWRGTVGIKR